MVVRVVPISLRNLAVADFGMVADDPVDAVGLVLALRHRGVARALGAAHRIGLLVHHQPMIGVGGALLDFGVGQFAGADRVAPGQLGRRGVVGDRLDLEDVQPAEFGDLFEAERGIVDQPGGGRMRHERLGHLTSPQTIRAAPSRSGRVGPRSSPRGAAKGKQSLGQCLRS